MLEISELKLFTLYQVFLIAKVFLENNISPIPLPAGLRAPSASQTLSCVPSMESLLVQYFQFHFPSSSWLPSESCLSLCSDDWRCSCYLAAQQSEISLGYYILFKIHFPTNNLCSSVIEQCGLKTYHSKSESQKRLTWDSRAEMSPKNLRGFCSSISTGSSL